ncbi:MAG: hypothetical protein ABSB76_24505 [Streptosporangiaceae bacterium]
MMVDQISFQAQQGSAGALTLVETSLSPADARTWQQRLTPFLQAGRGGGRAFLDFGISRAAIQWSGDSGQPQSWQYVRAYVGEPGQLSATQVLHLPPLDPAAHASRPVVLVTASATGPGYQSIAALARSAGAAQAFTPLLAHVLACDRVVNMPWQEPALAEAALWGLLHILEIIKEPQPLSFLSSASRSVAPDTLSGTFVSFCPGGSERRPEPGFVPLASFLAGRFTDNPDALRQEVAQHGIDMTADRAGSINRLFALLPAAQPKRTGEQPKRATEWWIKKPAPVTAPPEAPPAPTPVPRVQADPPVPAPVPQLRAEPPVPAPPLQAARRPGAPPGAGDVIVCPICLGDIADWNTQSPWEWEPTLGAYRKIPIPSGLTDLQRAPYLLNAYVRCTARQEIAEQPEGASHFLPANYGRYGRPVVLGFVGRTMAGKSHLLSAMVAGIDSGELRKGYQVSSDPLDHARHQMFVDSHVTPLREDKVLPGTGEADVLEFADAFLMKGESGQVRPVAFFDIAGGDLAGRQKKKATDFLFMADGLFFVVDPERLGSRWVDDNTFSNVLNILRQRPRPDPVSAAIVLTKADTLRFEEPIDRWLRFEPELEPLNATQFLRESADVYGYLESRDALALAAPYDKCAKATLHVASATGSSGAEANTVYSRGVRPRRVMRPLAAMLAMTGVLTGSEAEKVGI